MISAWHLLWILPYMTGDKVIYAGKTWESIVDGNVWAPDAYGWQEC